MSACHFAKIPFQEITELGFLIEMRVGENTGSYITQFKVLVYYPVVGMRYQSW